jgi:hypothetical protein
MLHHDSGTTIHYSGSSSKENKDPNNPSITMGIAAMQTTFRLRKPIRVIRSARSEWKHARSVGCRYDGLYDITRESTKIYENAGRHMRFRLERCAGQLARPTKGERGIWRG